MIGSKLGIVFCKVVVQGVQAKSSQDSKAQKRIISEIQRLRISESQAFRNSESKYHKV